MSVLVASHRAPKVNIAVLISDNSVTDSVRNLCRQYHPNVGYRRTPWPCSAAEHFNLILRRCTCDYLMIMHDDDRLHPDFFINIVNVILSNPKLVAVATNALVIDKFNSVILDTLFTSDSLYLIDSPIQLIRQYFRKPGNQIAPFPSYVYNRSIAQLLQFDQQLGGKHCDVAFLCKLVEYGDIAWIPSPLYFYRSHGRNDSSVTSTVDRFSLFFFLSQSYSSQLQPEDLAILKCSLGSTRKQMLKKILSRSLSFAKRIFAKSMFDDRRF